MYEKQADIARNIGMEKWQVVDCSYGSSRATALRRKRLTSETLAYVSDFEPWMGCWWFIAASRLHLGKMLTALFSLRSNIQVSRPPFGRAVRNTGNGKFCEVGGFFYQHWPPFLYSIIKTLKQTVQCFAYM